LKFALLMMLALPRFMGAADPSDELCVMTYNLRYASPSGPNAWPDRRPLVSDCIRGIDPDLFGTQEGLYHQVKDLASDLPAYDWIGLGRDGGSKGEFMAVFYRKDRFEPLEYDHFWLSDTPDVVASTTWGNSNRRMVTWVRFLDRETQRQFHFWNTHFDHQIQEAREKSATLIRRRVEALETDLPVLLVGDFNARAGDNQAYTTLAGDGPFTDSWTVAEAREGEGLNTFNGFRAGPHTGGSRIDWVLFKGPVKVTRAAIVVCERDGQHASDHFPVVAWIRPDVGE
jgi:endonuclease/exonuclease/phosphatase family metal-dependent hydrolase